MRPDIRYEIRVKLKNGEMITGFYCEEKGLSRQQCIDRFRENDKHCTCNDEDITVILVERVETRTEVT